MQKFENFDFTELDRKFAKKKFDRKKVVKKINVDDFNALFMIHFMNFFYSIPLGEENKLLYSEMEFNSTNSVKLEKNDKKIDPKDIIQAVTFIISKLGYSPFKKFPFVFLKDSDGSSFYYDLSFFIRQNVNFFNFVCANYIHDFLSVNPENNFFIRLAQYGLDVKEGQSYLFNKSYIIEKDEKDIKILSSNVSQLRNFLFAKDTKNVSLEKKIRWNEFEQKFIKIDISKI